MLYFSFPLGGPFCGWRLKVLSLASWSGRLVLTGVRTTSMLTVGFCRVDGLVLESISRLSTRRESQSIPGSLVQWALEVRTSCGVTGTIQKVMSMRFTNGMFRTGDIGYQDSDGYCYILDRLKDYGCHRR